MLNFMKSVWGSVALLLLVAVPSIALASADTTVAVPAGEIVGELATFALPIVGALVMWGLRQLPANLYAVAKTFRVDQLLTMAIGYGINAVAGAAKDKVLNVDVGNKVVAEATAYALDHGPEKIIEWLGGEEALRQKIIARLNLEPDAEIVVSPVGLEIVKRALSDGAPVQS